MVGIILIRINSLELIPERKNGFYITEITYWFVGMRKFVQVSGLNLQTLRALELEWEQGTWDL